VLGNVTQALGLAGSNGDENKLLGLVKGRQLLKKLRNSCLLKDNTPKIHDKKAERCKTDITKDCTPKTRTRKSAFTYKQQCFG
jgi:hypothetical protein